MTIKEYTDACILFSKESRGWSELPAGMFYTTRDAYEPWRESSDNDHGGIDVGWAFHRAVKDIRDQAPQRFLDIVSNELRNIVDDGCDRDALEWLCDVVEGHTYVPEVPDPMVEGLKQKGLS